MLSELNDLKKKNDEQTATIALLAGDNEHKSLMINQFVFYVSHELKSYTATMLGLMKIKTMGISKEEQSVLEKEMQFLIEALNKELGDASGLLTSGVEMQMISLSKLLHGIKKHYAELPIVKSRFEIDYVVSNMNILRDLIFEVVDNFKVQNKMCRLILESQNTVNYWSLTFRNFGKRDHLNFKHTLNHPIVSKIARISHQLHGIVSYKITYRDEIESISISFPMQKSRVK